ncbi:MAG: HD domain-containing protein, partial [Oscillospiraceae bacterium]
KLSEDLSRRDFTINAMAYSEAEGLIDIFGGKEDLQNGLIRSVGESRKRFAEDALRILRAVRLSSVLDFKIETKTSHAMVELAHTLSYPSAERKCSEFTKLLVGSGAAEALRENQEVLFALVPELCPTVSCTQETPNHFLNVFEHTLLALEAAPKILTVRLAVLFHDIGKPRCKSFDFTGSAHFYGHAATSAKMAAEILNRFRFEKKIVKRVCELVIHHDDALPFSPTHIKRLLATMGDTAFLELLEVKKSDIYGQNPAFFNLQRPFFAEAFSNYERIKKEHQCFSLSQLAITGDDLLQLGFTKDRRLGEALHTLLMAVIDGELPNQKKALLYRAEILKAKKTSDH